MEKEVAVNSVNVVRLSFWWSQFLSFVLGVALTLTVIFTERVIFDQTIFISVAALTIFGACFCYLYIANEGDWVFFVFTGVALLAFFIPYLVFIDFCFQFFFQKIFSFLAVFTVSIIAVYGPFWNEKMTNGNTFWLLASYKAVFGINVAIISYVKDIDVASLLGVKLAIACYSFAIILGLALKQKKSKGE